MQFITIVSALFAAAIATPTNPTLPECLNPKGGCPGAALLPAPVAGVEVVNISHLSKSIYSDGRRALYFKINTKDAVNVECFGQWKDFNPKALYQCSQSAYFFKPTDLHIDKSIEFHHVFPSQTGNRQGAFNVPHTYYMNVEGIDTYNQVSDVAQFNIK